jgi:glyoxylase-like metal-dependent hydrolase (beta-lactamase superfamily II)
MSSKAVKYCPHAKPSRSGRRLKGCVVCFLAAVAAVFADTVAGGMVAVRVAPEVYAVLGATGEPSLANSGRVGNSGFIVGPRGTVVVDTGLSYTQGRELLAAVAKVTQQPVRLVIITHGVQEYLFGSRAFAERHIPILAHRETAGLMRSRCETCLKNLRKLLGNRVMRGTRLVIPDRLLDVSEQITSTGRVIDVVYFGWASTPGDLAIYDRATGVLFAGGLVVAHQIPLLRDGQLEGWVAALDRLQQMRPERIVPGQGVVSGPNVVGETRDYLQALDAKVADLYGRGVSLSEAIRQGGLPQFADWDHYPSVHTQNIQRRYLQLEERELER